MPVRQMAEKKKFYEHEFEVNFKGNTYTLRILSEKSPNAFGTPEFERRLRGASVFDTEGRRLSGYDRREVIDAIDRGGLHARRIEPKEEISEFEVKKVGRSKYRATDIGYTSPKPKTVTIPVKAPAVKQEVTPKKEPLFTPEEVKELNAMIKQLLRDPKFLRDLKKEMDKV